AHEQDIVHRDVKPANILMSRGEPLVADFGIALALSEAGGGRITETGLSLGTPHYMSPEQASGERSLDKRSDVYAVGAVLYEMLTGEPPYGGPTAQAVLARILTETPRPVTAIRRTVPPNVDAAVLKALEKLPADRFESASTFRAALQDPAFRHSTADDPIASAAPTRPPAERSRTGSWGLAVLAAIAVVAAVLGWMRSPDLPAQPPVRVMLEDGSLESHFEEFAISRDGSRLAVVTPQGIMLRTSDDPEFRLIRGTEDGRDPVFSPDGEWLAFVNDFESLMKVSLDGGSPLTLATPENGAYMPSWSPDGRIVFANPTGVFVVSDGGGQPQPLATRALRHPLLLPDGAGLIGTTGDQQIVFVPPAGDSATVIIEQGAAATYVPELGHILYGHPSGGLFAAAFDPAEGALTGPIRPVFDDVAVAGTNAAFDVSGNGTLFYRPGAGAGPDGGEHVVIIDLDGDMDTVPLPPRQLDNLRFSPDGRFLAFHSDNQIYTYDLELGTLTQLTFEGENYFPVWSPDGTQIVYGANDAALMVKSADGGTAAREILRGDVVPIPTAWPTPDLLVYTLAGPAPDLLLLDPSADSVAPRPYLQAEWPEYGLSVSPDGSLAAYTSGETGPPQVFVRRFPEPQGQWRISDGEGSYPRWSADGSTIYYWASPQTADSLIAARIRTEPSVVVESRELIAVGEYDFDDWDFDPNTGRAAVVQDVGLAGDTQDWSLWLVVNWFTELEERLGTGGRR
ncbi:MAG: protein kinase, partial [Longimicrobiales bacterium]|nr:protein kinase [Longimicrobiales bacterium]